MYHDDLNREAKVFAQGLQYILEDTSVFWRRIAAFLGFGR
jgi:hypothetical protein